jgi:hypothetical protein
MPERRQCGIIGQVVAIVLSMALGLELGLELVDESVCGVMMSIGLISECVVDMLQSTAVALRLLELACDMVSAGMVELEWGVSGCCVDVN